MRTHQPSLKGTMALFAEHLAEVLAQVDDERRSPKIGKRQIARRRRATHHRPHASTIEATFAPKRDRMTPRRVLLSWSSGKDSAWALHVLREQPDVEVVGLLTTFNEVADRVAMHAVRRSLVDAQASATGLPLWAVHLPSPCSNVAYEERMGTAIGRAREEGVTHLAFGDLFLEDVRDYRIRQLSGTGIEPLFPLWCSPAATPELANRMLDGGVRAVLTCVDPKQLPESFVGRSYDAALLADLPPGVDPCGERGEFHTFCFGGPMFAFEIAVEAGETVSRDGFCFADFVRVPSASSVMAADDLLDARMAEPQGMERYRTEASRRAATETPPAPD